MVNSGKKRGPKKFKEKPNFFLLNTQYYFCPLFVAKLPYKRNIFKLKDFQ